MAIPKCDLLIRGIRDCLVELAEYDYIMGDIAIGTAPWRVLDGHYGALGTEPEADWLAEGALIVTLAFQWGVRDGAHAASAEDQKLISKMVDELRCRSARTERIARVIDMVATVQDTALVAAASDEIHHDYVDRLLRERG